MLQPFAGRPALRGPACRYAATSASVIIQTWPNLRPSLPVRHSLRTRDWSIDKRRATSAVVSVSTVITPVKRPGRVARAVTKTSGSNRGRQVSGGKLGCHVFGHPCFQPLFRGCQRLRPRAKHQPNNFAAGIVVNLKRPAAGAGWLFAVGSNKSTVVDGEFHFCDLSLRVVCQASFA